MLSNDNGDIDAVFPFDLAHGAIMQVSVDVFTKNSSDFIIFSKSHILYFLSDLLSFKQSSMAACSGTLAKNLK